MSRNRRTGARLWLGLGFSLGLAFAAAVPARTAPVVEKIGPHLYAYVSDNDASSNSTFLVRQDGILVVDTGLDKHEAAKILAAIRKVSQAPVRYIVNTHYHPDHQGGNGMVGPDAVVISTAFTRSRSEQMIAQLEKAPKKPGAPQFAFRLATLTFTKEIHIYLDGEPVEVYAPGPGHTMGDAVVYFPKESAVSTGDLFMNRSCPAMDKGSVGNWVKTLRGMIALHAAHYVPGHFGVGTPEDLRRFYDYMSTLWTQVQQLYRAGVPIDQVPGRLHLSAFSDFRQFPQFHATFADNAKHAYQELLQEHAPRSPAPPAKPPAR